MSRDQRVSDNHALLAAQKHALALKLPFAVLFVCNTTAAVRAREHYDFMLAGLYEVEAQLKKYNIPFIGLVGSHSATLEAVFHHLQPAAVYTDFNPLRGPRKLYEKIASKQSLIIVDTHNTVPAWLASDKQEIGARTLRPKIAKQLAVFQLEPEKLQAHPHEWPNKNIISFAEVADIFEDRLQKVARNHTRHGFVPGETAALKTLQNFITTRFKGYASNRNNPTIDGLSNLSPYLHFGQVSSLRVALNAAEQLRNDATLQPDYDALIEEMIVRKELSDNFCYYGGDYTSLTSAPAWAQSTLQKHAADSREFLYTREQFELAQTHDQAWNAAQLQLRTKGKIHGYMRMYWAKKVLEWSTSPDEALQTLIYLNDFYSLDGGDPNGYVGILWSVAGLHDRPWGERAYYGTVRSMVYNGLKRKFDIEAYIAQNNKNETIKKTNQSKSL